MAKHKESRKPKLATKFQLGAKNYTVELADQSTTNLGRSLSFLCKIEIQTTWEGREVPLDSRKQTLCHEVVHCIFDDIGRNDLAGDEALVQSFAALMHQFMETNDGHR